MKHPRWPWLLALVWLAASCCPHPGVFDQVRRSLTTVQSFYGDLLKETEWSDQIRLAVVAADTTLALAGELERQWCPAPGLADQLELQTRQAQKMAEGAASIKKGLTGAAMPEE
ncbi:MAG: hypothetical protein FJ126_00510 [Deltaproteobacteria bacterium]|nr:hypothetical protein [Deltaproteobacteria bacterium]